MLKSNGREREVYRKNADPVRVRSFLGFLHAGCEAS